MSEIQERFGQTPEEFFEHQAGQVYHFTAAHDDRYVWQEVTPQNLEQMPQLIQEVSSGWPLFEGGFAWSDFRRYRITGCAHRAYGPDGLCFTCGFGPAEI